jgi:1-aminocyclopropane-1-carboxylate deaminase
MSIYSKFLSKSKVDSFSLLKNNNRNIKLFVKRDDLIHEEISGNKLRKLKYNFETARKFNCKRIISFGGAYSNHLLALAAFGDIEGIATLGIVRGDELNKHSNKMLERCTELGMRLEFVSRSYYKSVKHQDGIINKKYDYYIPEGGANSQGVLGCKDIISETENDFDLIIVAQGTCTTSLGIYSAMSKRSKLLVVPVLKGYNSLHEMQKLAQKAGVFFDANRVEVLDQYHFGGYAKSNDLLDKFTSRFNALKQFQIEPTYTAKVLFALNDYLEKRKGIKKVLFVHTGGLFHYRNR